MKADLLPLVIDRDMRVEYILALEAGDAGDLSPLARLFASLERTAILQALSVDADEEIARDRSITAAVIASLTAKFDRRRDQKHAEFRHVDNLMKSLRSRARNSVEKALHLNAKGISIRVAQCVKHAIRLDPRDTVLRRWR